MADHLVHRVVAPHVLTSDEQPPGGGEQTGRMGAAGLRERRLHEVVGQRVDERTEAEEEAETLALLADPQHMHMSEQELVRALQSDREGAQEDRY